MKQLFIARMAPAAAFERVLFMIRKRAGRIVSTSLKHGSRASPDADLGDESDFYIASCSSKTVVYKGLMLPERIDGFYLDLRQDDVRSSLALVHSRFSTNTFPTWDRAHPYRRIAHNGEINTLPEGTNLLDRRAQQPAPRQRGLRRAPRRLQAHHPSQGATRRASTTSSTSSWPAAARSPT